MRPPATGRPARATPHSPRALDPVDAATHAPGPGLGPRAALPASRGSHGPQGAPDGHADTLARAPPAAWPAQRSPPARSRTPRCGALGASADRRLGRPRLPATAKAPAPTRPPAATHAPGPGLSPQATQPAHRRSLGPQRGPHRARRRPCARALRSMACRTRPPPARPPTPLCGTLRATADRRLDRP